MEQKLKDVQLKIFETFCALAKMDDNKESPGEVFKNKSLLLRDYLKEEQDIIKQVAYSESRKKGKHITEFSPKYCVIDIETTGLNCYYDEIIELSALKIENDIIVKEFSMLVKPSKRINSFIENLTGITNDMLDNACSIEEALDKFTEFVGSDIVLGYNVNFDVGFIFQNLRRYKDKTFSNNYTDLMAIAKNKLRKLTNYKLATVAKYFNINTNNMHRGLRDCKVTFECALKLKEL